jgi:hypothetical protein
MSLMPSLLYVVQLLSDAELGRSTGGGLGFNVIWLLPFSTLSWQGSLSREPLLAVRFINSSQ